MTEKIIELLKSYSVDYEIKEIKEEGRNEITFCIGDNKGTIFTHDGATPFEEWFMGGFERGVMIVCKEYPLMDRALLHLSQLIKQAIKESHYKGFN